MTSRLVTVILLTAEIKDLTAQITQRTQVRWSGDWNWKQKRLLVWTSSSHVNLMQPFWMHGIYVYMTSGWTWSRFRKWLKKAKFAIMVARLGLTLFLRCRCRRQERNHGTVIQRWTRIVRLARRLKRLRRIWAVLGHHLAQIKRRTD